MLSLRSFHVVFIVVSILLSLGVGVWGTQQYMRQSSGQGLTMAVVFFLTGILLSLYAMRYFGKLKRLE
jgi:FtsH-binding integral membrane protein